MNKLLSRKKLFGCQLKEKAEENLLFMINNSCFTLKEKIDYFEKKWKKEHIFKRILQFIIMICIIIYGFIDNNGLQLLGIIIEFI